MLSVNISSWSSILVTLTGMVVTWVVERYFVEEENSLLFFAMEVA